MAGINSETYIVDYGCMFWWEYFKTRSVEATILQFNQLYKDNSRKAGPVGNLTEVPDKSVFVKYLIKELEKRGPVPFFGNSIVHPYVMRAH